MSSLHRVLNCLSFLHSYLLFYGRGLGTVMQADYINFVFKCRSFRYRGVRAGWSEANYIAQLISLTPEQPLGYLVENRGRTCYTKIEL